MKRGGKKNGVKTRPKRVAAPFPQSTESPRDGERAGFVAYRRRRSSQADYGAHVTVDPSPRLLESAGGGHTVTNLAYFRLFDPFRCDRRPAIPHEASGGARGMSPSVLLGEFVTSLVTNSERLVEGETPHKAYAESEAEHANCSVPNPDRQIRLGLLEMRGSHGLLDLELNGQTAKKQRAHGARRGLSHGKG